MVDVAMVETIQAIVASPWYGVMAFLWAIGWFIKVQMPGMNKYIPSALVGAGMILGYVIIEATIMGVIAGFLMAIVAVGVHSGAKNTIELINIGNSKDKDKE